MRPDTELEIVSAAPGRANLIGEHTDYNDGFVLPVALELRTVVRGRRASQIRLTSDGHAVTVEVDPLTGDGPTDGWGRYVTAVVRALLEAGHNLRGIDGHVSSDVPVGAGLSSSAAFEVALALAVADEPLGAVAVARVCQRAENEHVGVRSGIMDQLVSAGASPGAALFIDCRSLETEDVPVPADVRILVIDSGERRQLAAGEYNRRRDECEEAARRLGVPSLRELAVTDLADLALDEPLAGRVRHVVSENARVRAARDALRKDHRHAVGELLAESHRSLRDDYEVSTPRLDALVEAAAATPGVIGARMTGAGFGGSIVALAEAAAAHTAMDEIAERYRRSTGREARGWISTAGAGAIALRGAVL